jgi:hypothetical protein
MKMHAAAAAAAAAAALGCSSPRVGGWVREDCDIEVLHCRTQRSSGYL